jgi:hypothetical protein
MIDTICNGRAWCSRLAPFVGVVLLGGSGLLADAFLYNPTEVLLGFRQAGGSSEMEVNLGPATNYMNLAPGAQFVVSALDTNRLAQVFAELNGVSWSVAGTQHFPDATQAPFNTIWVTRPRSNLATQSKPWVRLTEGGFGSPSAKIESMAQNAASYSTAAPGAVSWTNTVILPAGDRHSYGNWITGQGNFGSFPGTVEKVTPADFTMAGQPVAADFYLLLPGSAADGTLNTPGTFLGYFTFQPSGIMTFTAAGGSVTPPAQPQITAIQRTNGVTSVSFTTEANATYSLLGVGDAGLATTVTNWPALGAAVPGTGQTVTVPDASGDPTRFYSVRATRP